MAEMVPAGRAGTERRDLKVEGQRQNSICPGNEAYQRDHTYKSEEGGPNMEG